MMHPHYRAKSPGWGSKAQVRVTPIDGLRSQPLNYVHNWASPNQPKKSDHAWKACPVAWYFMWKGLRSGSWDNRRIVDVASDYKPLHLWKMVGPSTAASSSTRTRPVGENWSKASSSLYLDELLVQKCQFRGHFKVPSLSLEKLSPKGSCHLDESSMNHPLAQNSLIEFLMWNATDVQKALTVNWHEWNLHCIYIYIYIYL